MRLIFLLLLSVSAFGQESYPASYVIKCDGSLKYVNPEKLEVITKQSSLENGILIKPEGIVVLKTGKEQVLKNGELIDETGNLFLASDSLIQEIRFAVLNQELKNVQGKLHLASQTNQLLVKKSLLLSKGNRLLNQKAELLSKINSENNRKRRLKKDLDSINLEIKTVESKISEIDKLLEG